MTLAPWPLWSKLQGSGFDLYSRESSGAHPGATTGVTSAHGVGCTGVAPSTSDPSRYPPRGAQHASARPRQACLSHSAWLHWSCPQYIAHWSCPQYIELVPHRPEGWLGPHSSATTGVIRALGVVPLKLPPEVRICAEPSREKARPAFGTTTGAVPYSMWLLWSEPQGAGLGVASRGRLVSNPTTIIGTSSGRRCCFLELPPGRRVCAAVP